VPFSGEFYSWSSLTVSVPVILVIGGIQPNFAPTSYERYVFDHWNTGENEPTINVLLTQDLTLIAYYTEY